MQQGGQIRKVMAGIRRILLYHIISYARTPGRQQVHQTHKPLLSVFDACVGVRVCGGVVCERLRERGEVRAAGAPFLHNPSIYALTSVSQSASQSINTCPS